MGFELKINGYVKTKKQKQIHLQNRENVVALQTF